MQEQFGPILCPLKNSYFAECKQQLTKTDTVTAQRDTVNRSSYLCCSFPSVSIYDLYSSRKAVRNYTSEENSLVSEPEENAEQ